MANLAIQAASLTGLAKTMVAASAGGDSFANDGKTIFYIKNGGGSAVTVTVDSFSPCNQGYSHDLVVSVGAGSEISFPELDVYRFNDNNGNVNVTYSGVTSVTVAAVKVR